MAHAWKILNPPLDWEQEMSQRLTPQQLLDRSVPEAQLQDNIIDMAHTFGWLVAHFRPALTERGRWITAVSADGTGFPDLVMVHGRRVIFAEVKRETEKLSVPQQVWIDCLSDAEGVEVYVWRPSNMDAIQQTLATEQETDES